MKDDLYGVASLPPHARRERRGNVPMGQARTENELPFDSVVWSGPGPPGVPTRCVGELISQRRRAESMRRMTPTKTPGCLIYDAPGWEPRVKSGSLPRHEKYGWLAGIRVSADGRPGDASRLGG